ncbi:plasmid maintenance protein [Borreliella burgdorferi]|uniref:plasmid maintenance protein n=1 Tax=Borreliella burgdorferi TaxID=139 RepID=UPI003DA5BE14
MLRAHKLSYNKHQHKLIVLLSTIFYVNKRFKKYNQNQILYYLNGNLKRNGQKEIKLKTLQNYLYKLEKEIKITKNYYKHLGINMGTEVYYNPKYSKEECYSIINKYFKDKKEKKFENRINKYYKETCNKNRNLKKWECNINNIIKEEKTKLIEKLQINKYAKKCKFTTNYYLSILKLKDSKENKIEILKSIKRTENYFIKSFKENRIGLNKGNLIIKQKKLNEILNKIEIQFKEKFCNDIEIETEIQKIYENYKNKPHFIIESNKYEDLNKIIKKLECIAGNSRANVKEHNINKKNNILNILLDQLKLKMETKLLIIIIKDYLNRQTELKYKNIFNNQYYFEVLKIIENNKEQLKLNELKGTAN